MNFFEVDAATALAYTHHPARNGLTFLFVNSSGATGAAWEGGVAPALAARGFGTLTLDLRGQGESRYPDASAFDTDEIVGDIRRVIAGLCIGDFVAVGLSIGGLRAAHVVAAEPGARGLVLINTLRLKGPLTAWLGELETRLIAMGGPQLVHDCFRPVTVGTAELARIRPGHLPDTYTPMAEDHPRRRLAEGARRSDWGFDWAGLSVPVLALTGMRDRLFRVQDEVDAILATIPDAREVRFEDAGHALHTEEPDRAAAEIAAFAAALPRQSDAA